MFPISAAQKKYLVYFLPASGMSGLLRPFTNSRQAWNLGAQCRFRKYPSVRKRIGARRDQATSVTVSVLKSYEAKKRSILPWRIPIPS